jgi:hypothetical protein
MHFHDLTLCRYQDGPFDPDNWRVPLFAIGWLEHPHQFTDGEVPRALASTLREMANSPLAMSYAFWGMHTCSLCVALNRRAPEQPWSQRNIFIPGRNVVYLSPSGIDHYMDVHSYRPPQEYVDAVTSCPAYGSNEYWNALRAANLSHDVPLERWDDAP